MSTIMSKPYEAGSDYVLPRDESERERLNSQHYVMKILMYESRLVYDKAIRFDPGSQVLDSGTGTGIWLEDLSKQVPSTVKLYGCDVSPNNFPQHYAENINFLVASVTSLPPDWSGKFDLIHQRLLFGGLISSEWPIALSEMHRVLKPGGSVQLMELDFSHAVSAGPVTRRLQSLVIEVFNKRGLLHDCSGRLPKLLEQAEFVDVRSEKRYLMAGKAWGRIGELGTTNFTGVFRGIAPALLASGIIGSELEMEELLKEGVEEWNRSEEGVRFVGHIVCARKAFMNK